MNDISGLLEETKSVGIANKEKGDNPKGGGGTRREYVPPVRKGINYFLSLVTTGRCCTTRICVIRCTTTEIRFK